MRVHVAPACTYKCAHACVHHACSPRAERRPPQAGRPGWSTWGLPKTWRRRSSAAQSLPQRSWVRLEAWRLRQSTRCGELRERRRSLRCRRARSRRALPPVRASASAARERYERWQRQEVRQVAGAQWLSELAEQRESEQGAAAAEDERGSAAPYQRPPAARRSASSLLPGVAVTLHGLSGPRGEALNGRSSIWSKCRRSIPSLEYRLAQGDPPVVRTKERVQRGPSPLRMLRKGCAVWRLPKS